MAGGVIDLRLLLLCTKPKLLRQEITNQAVSPLEIEEWAKYYETHTN